MSEPIRPDSWKRTTVHQRYEAKYLLTPVSREMIRDYVLDYTQPDSHHSRYVITSVYYDSPTWHTFRSSLYGEKNRFKLRVRAYDRGGERCYAEVKQRIDRIIVKKRFPIEASLHDAVRLPIADWAYRMRQPENDRDRAAFETFERLAARLGASPCLGVRYMREAFESIVDEPVRVTVDSELACLPVNEMLRGRESGMPVWRLVDRVPAVLEVKFTDSFPFWVRQLVDRFELARASLAKYVACVQSVADEGGLRETGAQEMSTWTS